MEYTTKNVVYNFTRGLPFSNKDILTQILDRLREGGARPELIEPVEVILSHYDTLICIDDCKSACYCEDIKLLNDERYCSSKLSYDNIDYWEN